MASKLKFVLTFIISFVGTRLVFRYLYNPYAQLPHGFSLAVDFLFWMVFYVVSTLLLNAILSRANKR